MFYYGLFTYCGIQQIVFIFNANYVQPKNYKCLFLNIYVYAYKERWKYINEVERGGGGEKGRKTDRERERERETKVIDYQARFTITDSVHDNNS